MSKTSVIGCLSGVGDTPIELIGDRERFLGKIRAYQREPELFIDVETADWRTGKPRVALLQVWAGREVAVFDVLAPGMGEVLFDWFVPYVMANQRIRKWAHNASYERRLLGGESVQNLGCTLQLARSFAFHRLPSDTLSLASLTRTLFGVALDKSFQKADWSVRPLSEEHLRYAAADTVWCARVRTALEAIDRVPRPEADDPERIDAAFSEAKLRELDAQADLTALREGVRGLMTREGMTRFSGFVIGSSERSAVLLRSFVHELAHVDPVRMLDVEIQVTNEMLDLLDGSRDRVLEACRTTQSPTLHAPRLRRPRGEAVAYGVATSDAERVTRDYESRARTVRLAKSLVDELKQRMRDVLKLRGATGFKSWSLAPGPVSSWIDVRDAISLAAPWADTMVPFTKKFQLAIGEEGLAALEPAIQTKSSFVLRWRPRGEPVVAAPQESRDWVDPSEEDE